MKIKKVIQISLFTALLTACTTSNKITADNFHNYETPPNGIKISDSLYCDQTEINNLNWMEYMFWNKKTFGAQSYEYISTLPDTSVWLETDSCLHSYVKYYLRHPAYRNYPVVGVSQNQAEKFSKWRSDRVFEYLLVKHKVIEFDTAQTRESYFTIEKYFKCELQNVISDIKVHYYPKFRLPSITERQLILAYSDSIDKTGFEKYNSKKCSYYNESYPKIWSNIIPCVKDTFKIDPTRAVYMNCTSKKIKPIYNLRGNVNEWTSEVNIATGGGWKDRTEDILLKDTFDLSRNTSISFGSTKRKHQITDVYNLEIKNAWTGFRNVCEWKKWEED